MRSASHLVHLAAPVALLAAVSPLAAQGPDPAAPRSLFSPVAAVDSAALAFAADQRAADRTIAGTRFVHLDEHALHHAALLGTSDEQAVRLDLGNGTVLDIVLRAAGEQLGYRTLVGTIDGQASAPALVLAIGPDGDVGGVLQHGGRDYRLRYAGGPNRLHALFEVDPDLDHGRATTCAADRVGPPTPDSVQRTSSGNLDGGGSSAPTLIDVCVFYTPAARQLAGNSMASTVAAAFAQANVASRTSGVDHELRMVYLGETSYVETGSTTDLQRFQMTQDGFMDEVHAIRDTFGGDLMVLITDNAFYCGVAYGMASPLFASRIAAFSVTVFPCVGSSVMAHEMAHNMGCNHDRRYAGPGGSAYPYSYGYRTPDSAYHTIMAYPPGQVAWVWSSPTVVHQGYTMGTANDDSVRTLNNTKDLVAAYTPQTLYRWENLGGGIAGRNGKPILSGRGAVNGAEPIEITLSNTQQNALGVLVLGDTQANTPLQSGVLVPRVRVSVPLRGSAAPITLAQPWMAQVPASVSLYWQAWLVDASAPRGLAASDGVRVSGL